MVNKVFKTLKLSNVIKWLLLNAVCLMAANEMCVLMLLLCLPGTYGIKIMIQETLGLSVKPTSIVSFVKKPVVLHETALSSRSPI